MKKERFGKVVGLLRLEKVWKNFKLQRRVILAAKVDLNLTSLVFAKLA